MTKEKVDRGFCWDEIKTDDDLNILVKAFMRKRKKNYIVTGSSRETESPIYFIPYNTFVKLPGQYEIN